MSNIKSAKKTLKATGSVCYLSLQKLMYSEKRRSLFANLSQWQQITPQHNKEPLHDWVPPLLKVYLCKPEQSKSLAKIANHYLDGCNFPVITKADIN